MLPNLLHPAGHRAALIGYGSAHFGKSLLWSGEDALTLYILIRYLDLHPAVAGTVFLASALWNALCDGLFGLALARWPGLWRWLPALMVPAIIGAGMGFAILPMVARGSVIASIALLFLFRTSFCLVDIPHNALTKEFAMRIGHLPMARIRSFIAGMAALCIGLVGFQLLQPGGMDQNIVELLIFSIGLVACILMAPVPFLLRHHAPAAPPAGKIWVAAPRHFAMGRELRFYCLATLIGLAGLAALGKAILHIEFKAASIGAAALLLLTVGRVAAIWLWTPLAHILGHRPALALSYVLGGLSTFYIPTLTGMTGWPLIIALLMCGTVGGGITFLSWAVLTETLGPEASVADTAAGFGLFTMSMKIGLGLSAILVGWWLSHQKMPDIVAGDAIFSLAIWVLAATLVAAFLILLSGQRRVRPPVSAAP